MEVGARPVSNMADWSRRRWQQRDARHCPRDAGDHWLYGAELCQTVGRSVCFHSKRGWPFRAAQPCQRRGRRSYLRFGDKWPQVLEYSYGTNIVCWHSVTPAWVNRMSPGRALIRRSTKPQFILIGGDESGIGKEIATGVGAPLQGLAYNLIREIQAVGLGWDRTPPWGLKAPPHGENC